MGPGGLNHGANAQLNEVGTHLQMVALVSGSGLPGRFRNSLSKSLPLYLWGENGERGFSFLAA